MKVARPAHAGPPRLHAALLLKVINAKSADTVALREKPCSILNVLPTIAPWQPPLHGSVAPETALMEYVSGLPATAVKETVYDDRDAGPW